MGEKKPSKFTVDDLSDVTVFRESAKMKKFILDNIYGKLIAGMQFDYGGEEEPDKVTLTITFNDDTNVSANFEMNNIESMDTEVEGDIVYIVITMTDGTVHRVPLDISDLVTVTTTQTITGDKTFTGDVNVPDIDGEITESNKAVNERALKVYASERIDAIEDEIGDVGQAGTIRGDIADNDANAVHKTGDETVGGNKTFSLPITIYKSKPQIFLKDVGMPSTTTIPTNDRYSQIIFSANDNTVCGLITFLSDTSGNHKMSILCTGNNGLSKEIKINISANGETYVTCPSREYSPTNTDDIVNNGNLENRLSQLTKADVGLGNVDNTSDMDKPISTAQREEFNNAFDDIRYLDDNKQVKLLSGTNIKTVNGESLLGSGNIPISLVGTWGDIGGQIKNQTDLQEEFDTKQDTLVSGTNIKTIGGQNLLGNGDIAIGSGYWKTPTSWNELLSAKLIILTHKVIFQSPIPDSWTTPPTAPSLSASSSTKFSVMLQRDVIESTDNHIYNSNNYNVICHLKITFNTGYMQFTPYCFNGGGRNSGSSLTLTESNYENYVSLSDSLIWVSR